MVKKKLEHIALVIKSISASNLRCIADNLVEQGINKFSLLTDVYGGLSGNIDQLTKEKALKINLQQINQGQEILLAKFKDFLFNNYESLEESTLKDYDKALRRFMDQGSDFLEPDLVIIASDINQSGSGSSSLANNLVWESNYAEIYFSSKSSEDIDVQELEQAIDDYYKRQRNFGE